MKQQALALDEVCLKITDGTHHSPPIVPSGMPYVTAKHVKPEGLTFFDAPWYISEEDHRAIYSRCDPKKGDVLYIKDGATTGIAALNNYDFPFSMLSSVALLRPKPELCDPGFLCWWLNSPLSKEKFIGQMGGAAIKRLTLSKIKQFEIPLPPLPEQKRIAAVLDKAEELRAKRRAALAQLDSLTQSIFLEMFGDPATNPKGWQRIPFCDLLENIDSGWSPNCLDRPVMNKEWGILKLGAVTWCEYDPTENKALPPNVEPDTTIEVKGGDLLFARKNTRELVAACALVCETPPRLLMSDLIFRLRLRQNAQVDSCFLHQLLIYPTKRRDIQKLAGGSAGSMPNISKARLQTTLIEVPPIELQREFSQRVTAVEKLKATQRASLAELDTLFASLQYKAFRGEL